MYNFILILKITIKYLVNIFLYNIAIIGCSYCPSPHTQLNVGFLNIKTKLTLRKIGLYFLPIHLEYIWYKSNYLENYEILQTYEFRY